MFIKFSEIDKELVQIVLRNSYSRIFNFQLKFDKFISVVGLIILTERWDFLLHLFRTLVAVVQRDTFGPFYFSLILEKAKMNRNNSILTGKLQSVT